MKLEYPLKGIGTIPGIYITQKFGGNYEIYKQFGLQGHNGWDIAAPHLTPLYAVHDGIIQFLTEEVNYGTGYGKNVRLYFDEDGFTWDCIYGHLDHYEGVPRQVKAGDLIGYVDNTGFSTGHHLHFGVRKLLNGVVVDYNNGYFGYVDPAPYFEGVMTKKFIVNDGGKIGVLILEGFTGMVAFAKDLPSLQKLKESFEVPNDAKTINLP